MDVLKFSFYVMFIFGLMIFSFKHKHLLMMLISLEFVMLSVYMMMFKYFLYINNLSFINIIFLTFSVCEGVLGLSIMISLVRSHGNDYFNSFNVLC